MTLPHRPLRVLLATLLASACAPPTADRAGYSGDVGPDGERGHGWFETAWGTEELDFRWDHGQRVYDGDLVLDPEADRLAPVEGRAQASLLSRSGLAWEMDSSSGVVTIPYEISNTGSLGATTFGRTQTRIRTALDHWETYTRRPGGGQLLRFVPHGSQSRFVEFQVKNNGGVCYVSLHATGKTRVDSDPACRWQTFVHEVGHVLTFRHEQKRDDRPGNVVFHADRTNEDPEFTMVHTGSHLGTAYDSYSIMHYPSCMFALSSCRASTPSAWVLERVRGTPYISWWSDRAVGEVLSPTDVCGVRTLYGLSCGGGSTMGADAGVPPEPDAGVPDAGPPSDLDGGVPPASDYPFPVSSAMAGWLQRYSTSECATPSSADPTALVLATCDETMDTMRWGFSPTSALRNEGSARCAEPSADVDGASVEQHDCRPDDAQAWRLGEVELVNGSTGMCVQVPSSDYFDGQHLVYRDCSGAVSQRFAFLPATHEIAAQGWCFTAGASGARVELHPCDGSSPQRWIETNGGFAAEGLCLHVRGGAGAASGAILEVADCNGAVGQMWGLRGRVAYFDDEKCLAGTEMDLPLELALCGAAADDETMIWWPRAACAPLDCPDLGASCGSFDDGCGEPLECGECAAEPSDLDGGVGELEECLPLECPALSCGPMPDDCGGTVDCGPCPASDCGCRVVGARRGAGAMWLGALMLLAALRRRRSRR